MRRRPGHRLLTRQSDRKGPPDALPLGASPGVTASPRYSALLAPFLPALPVSAGAAHLPSLARAASSAVIHCLSLPASEQPERGASSWESHLGGPCPPKSPIPPLPQGLLLPRSVRNLTAPAPKASPLWGHQSLVSDMGTYFEFFRETLRGCQQAQLESGVGGPPRRCEEVGGQPGVRIPGFLSQVILRAGDLPRAR